MVKLTKEQAIKLIATQEVYDAMSVSNFFDEKEQRTVTIYEILEALGISVEEIKKTLA